MEKFEVGAGIGPMVSEPFEIKPSLLPVGTFQEGPPCINVEKIKLNFADICCNLQWIAARGAIVCVYTEYRLQCDSYSSNN